MVELSDFFESDSRRKNKKFYANKWIRKIYYLTIIARKQNNFD